MSAVDTLQAVRGMNDLLPSESPQWQALETTMRELMQAYGYQEIRLPIVEKTALFQRSIGEVTDIVEKEMYTFPDRNEELLTLRPEGTAGCVRAGIQHGLFYNQSPRLWYMGPMFRYERPQKGRYRQFTQLGVEAFNLTGPDIDVELMLLTARLWQLTGLADEVKLEINTLGTPACRQRYREVLVAFLTRHQDALDADSQRRLHRNPLRVLDSKHPDTQAIVAEAPKLLDYLDAEARAYFDELQQLLNDVGLHYTFNPQLVRGLDYYNHGVFEWTTQALGAQGTVCAGGRYDGLVEQLGGKPTPACGFAIGLERLVALLAQRAPSAVARAGVEVYLIVEPDRVKISAALTLAETLRTQLPGRRIATHVGGGSLKSQFKRADKSGAEVAVILDATSLDQQRVGLKFLRQSGEQLDCPLSTVAEHLTTYFAEGPVATGTVTNT